ncbi:PREDICTED: receptor protein kinase-like protein At4g34220 [Tarenaya hassleriana]|uniref:receptor protein kinase-like protein At4g34220 n=1 Tax=Tarenaya hassleriana TaxID=28532 RepID=UPI00053C2FBA|nr:PREDICTED: receptor protein kinase-like protein At4g34220 [Tarenaya hassleriana]
MTSNGSNLMSLFLFSFLFCLLVVPRQLQALTADGVLLLSFKYSVLSDPFSVLENWNYDDATPCSWSGVTCTQLGNPTTPDMFRVTSLVLPNKQLLGSLSSSLFSIPHLRILDLSNNSFNGSLPDSAFNATELRVLSLGNNDISGELPEKLSSMASLRLLNLSANTFAGKIPRNLTLLKNLTVISLSSNSLSGDLPSGFEAVQVLDLSSNLLTGSLPLNFGGKSLRYLSLSHNNISGTISPGFAEEVPANAIIDLSFNNLTGPIPESVPLLNQKTESFTGNPSLCGKPLKNLCSIPSTLSNPPNNTSETTSPAIAVMPRTTTTTNPLTESPNQTAKSKLKPSTIVGITVADIAGLAILAMFILYVYQLRKRRSYEQYSTFSVLKECLEKNDALSTKKSNHHLTPITTEVTESPPAKTACGSCIIMNRGDDETSASEANSSESDVENQIQDQQTIQALNRTDGGRFRQSTTQTQLVTVDGETKLELDALLKASAYVLGSIGSGILYKAVLENGSAFAVRRIGTESCATARLKEFEREVRTIAKLRHRNLVRVRGFCWGDDEKLLISDYVPNGSLPCSINKIGKAGSSSSSSQGQLSLEVRLKIARGIARGLAYVHEKKRAHGNIKPNNIILDTDYEPIITDLGLDRLTRQAHKPSSHNTGPSSSPSAGPTADPYKAPESWRSQKPNPKWDVYSFGVVMLELMTGRVFSMDRDLGQLSNMFESGAEERGMILRSVEGAIRADVARKEDRALAWFRLGFGCVSSLPHKRPSMKEVCQVLDKTTLYGLIWNRYCIFSVPYCPVMENLPKRPHFTCVADGLLSFKLQISKKKKSEDRPKMGGGSPCHGAGTQEALQPNTPSQIFILSGQSNMAGRGGVVKDHHHNRWVWDGGLPPECASNPAILRLSADLRWEQAREPLHADIDTGKVCGVGPGMAFSNAVRERVTINAPAETIGLVPCASGGTAIREWERGSHLYERMVRRTKESRRSGGEVKALLWYQGESDVSSIHDAESYGSNMKRLIKDLRGDLELPDLPIVQVAIASGGGHIEKVREAQLGLKMPNVVTVDAMGLPLKPDNLHLTTEAQAKLGLLLAEAYLSNFT